MRPHSDLKLSVAGLHTRARSRARPLDLAEPQLERHAIISEAASLLRVCVRVCAVCACACVCVLLGSDESH